ncbi:MAG TPA: hypothetical protein VHA71_04535 [Rhodanobacteraceae bacterium]|nr:hypothetical protein [Rhodanobacteraceae bacterium]
MRKPSMLCIASLAAALAACGSGSAPASPGSSAASASSTPSLIAGVVDRALERAETKLRNENITISGNDGIVVLSDSSSSDTRASGLPRAQITPQGELLIGDKPVALTPGQRAMLLDYRRQLIEIGAQGIAIGKQGAALGMSAAREAIAGAFSGKPEQEIRQRVEAKASGIREAAAKLCDRMPALMESQQKLAAALPAFKPYATLTEAKIDECRKDALHDDDND